MGAWTLKEEVVLVYYVTRNITYASIIEIMAASCGTGVRTSKHVSDKVTKLRNRGVLEQTSQHFFLRNRDQHWNIKRADRWILLSMSKAELDILLDFNDDVAAIVGEKNNLGRFLNIMHMDDGGWTYRPSRFNLYYEYQSRYLLDHLYQPQNTGMQGVHDAGHVDWPGHFNQQYELPTLSPMPSARHFDYLYQPENTDDGGLVHWPEFPLDQLYQRQFEQHYELPKLSPCLSPYHLDHFGHPGHLEQLDQLDQLDQ